ncbi:MAG: hypothetical protein IJ587_05125 [Synergistaceae bacterium]|nr:hypothetical protein [Synergistaceae bacterium]
MATQNMATSDMELRLELIRSLKAERDELEAQITALEDEVKSELDTQGVSSMTVGKYTVKYTRYFSNRFDTTSFKEEHRALYDTYTKTVPTSRFTVNYKEGAE